MYYLTMGDTVGFLANSDTLGTVIHFTCLIRTHDLAIRFLTLDITYSIFRFLTRGMTFGWFTYRSTYCITFGVITFPGTFRVTLQLL